MKAPFWTPEKMNRAQQLWRDGDSAAEIGAVFGVSKNAFLSMCLRHRERFPARRTPRNLGPARQHAFLTPPEPIVHHNRVVRVTAWGAYVTMPRVTMLDGEFMR